MGFCYWQSHKLLPLIFHTTFCWIIFSWWGSDFAHGQFLLHKQTQLQTNASAAFPLFTIKINKFINEDPKIHMDLKPTSWPEVWTFLHLNSPVRRELSRLRKERDSSSEAATTTTPGAQRLGHPSLLQAKLCSHGLLWHLLPPAGGWWREVAEM